jgi:hypothetical protein
LTRQGLWLSLLFALAASNARAVCPYDANCINNPYGGRDQSAPPGVMTSPFGIYGNSQLSNAFNANPLRYGPTNNPYAPALNLGDGAGAPAKAHVPNGLGNSLSAGPGGLQGVDPDRQNAPPGGLQGVDPDRQQ